MASTPDNSLKSQLPFELVYQVVALIAAVILVHLVYITVIRPNAEAILVEQAERTAAGEEGRQEQQHAGEHAGRPGGPGASDGPVGDRAHG